MKESVWSLKEKQHHKISFATFELPTHTKRSVMTDRLNIMFDDFGIRLLGYRIELSTFSTRSLFHKYLVTMKYRFL